MKEIKDYKIVLAGPQSSGKTTLMNAWSEKHLVPIVRTETKSMMPDGINSHLDILRMATESPQEGVKFQQDLIETRFNLFSNADCGFISDRSVVDSYVYYSIHNSMFASTELNNNLSKLSKESINLVDITIILSPDLSKSKVSNNGIRIESIPYYEAISNLISSTILRYSSDYINSTKVQVSKDVTIRVLETPTTTIALIDESNCEFGISSVEVRIKAIEMAIDFIRITKDIYNDD